ncbi:MAG TPA: hypothetical protein VLK85_35735 [Ramlibacter sp.]|nr:hypothetical protein [Ramlibacter sp.]
MRKTLIAFAVALGALSGAAQADVLEMPAAPSAAAVATPARGSSMGEVSRQFGAPSEKYAPVGGASRVQPPITRWDYPDFSVFFERSHVVDVVVKGVPMPIVNKDELQPASP